MLLIVLNKYTLVINPPSLLSMTITVLASDAHACDVLKESQRSAIARSKHKICKWRYCNYGSYGGKKSKYHYSLNLLIFYSSLFKLQS